MSISFPKKALSCIEIIEHLKNRGLIIENEKSAADTLCYISYYRLRGYYIHWYDKNTKQFKDGITLEKIVALYKFDIKFRALISEMLAHIEVAFRAHLTNEIGVSSGPLGYLDPSIFLNKSYFWKNNSIICKQIEQSNEIFVGHHYENYDGALPIWAVAELISFGTLSKIFKNLGQHRTIHQITLRTQ